MDQAAENILVVGFDANFQYLMRRYASQSAFQLVFSNIGDDVVDLALQHHPAAIIMAEESGNSVAKDALGAILANPCLHMIPVVVCLWSDERDCQWAGMAHVRLHMPLMLDDFHAALEQVGLNSRGPSVHTT